MKIEKINDNQIRCTLTSKDLESRKLRLSELAYGTEKAKDLFRDMMEQANYEFGFEAENMPIMIEAIPVSPDSIILIITKVEDPEELDTRFSKFSPSNEDATEEDIKLHGADDILDLFQKIQGAKENLLKKAVKEVKDPPTHPSDDLLVDSSSIDMDEDQEPKDSFEDDIPLTLVRQYEFKDLDTVIQVADILVPFYQDENSLYKDEKNHTYRLVLHQSDCTPETFNKVCNVLSEYGLGKNITPAAEAYLIEHNQTIISYTALQDLKQLSY